MSVPKHPIAHHWIKQTLVPFLLYAFASTLSYPADISSLIESAIHFCLWKPDYPSDGDDLVFERIFMAIMHRHKNLAPDLEMVVDHLEPLTKYLIRRAQLKGPYDLLERTDIGSDAWVAYERQRLDSLMLQREDTKQVRPPPAPAKPRPNEQDIDPRLLHAQPGHFTEAGTPILLTADEEKYYRRQNHKFEQFHLRREQQHLYNTSVLPQANISTSTYTLPGRDVGNMSIAHGSSYQQPLAPTYSYTEQNVQQYGISQRHTGPTLGSHAQTHAANPRARTTLPNPFTHNADQHPTIPTTTQYPHSPHPHFPSSQPLLHSLSYQAAAHVSPYERDVLAYNIMQRQRFRAGRASPSVASAATHNGTERRETWSKAGDSLALQRSEWVGGSGGSSEVGRRGVEDADTRSLDTAQVERRFGVVGRRGRENGPLSLQEQLWHVAYRAGGVGARLE
ncbi:hypothetical protein M3J09_013522 [Ascochyta lentis]